MGYSHNNGQPPIPEGMHGVSGPQRECDLVVWSDRQNSDPKKTSVIIPLALCVAGALSAAIAPPMACLLMGFGTLCAGAGRGRGAQALIAVGTLVLCGVGGAYFGVDSVPNALIVGVLSLASAFAVEKGGMRPGVACVIVALAAAAQIGDAIVAAMMANTSVGDSFIGVLAANPQLLESAGLDAAGRSLVEWAVRTFWPAAFSTTALIEFLCAYAGCGLAARRLRDRKVEWPDFGLYDLPLWVVAVFVASLAGCAAWYTHQEATGNALLMVSGNALLTVRYALAAQGLAVLAWQARARKVPRLTCVAVVLVAMYLEAQFIVMSVVGLLDIWVNFRHLPRGEEQPVQGEPKQD